MKDTVAIAFINDRKILVVKSVRSARNNMYTLIGGLVEDNESLLDACVRESKEEINNELNVYNTSFEEIMSYIEPADSNPEQEINIHLFISKKTIDVELITNFEIIDFKYINSFEQEINLSSSVIKFIKYAKERSLID